MEDIPDVSESSNLSPPPAREEGAPNMSREPSMAREEHEGGNIMSNLMKGMQAAIQEAIQGVMRGMIRSDEWIQMARLGEQDEQRGKRRKVQDRPSTVWRDDGGEGTSSLEAEPTTPLATEEIRCERREQEANGARPGAKPGSSLGHVYPWLPSSTLTPPGTSTTQPFGFEAMPRFDGKTERSYREFVPRFKELMDRHEIAREHRAMMLINACEPGEVKEMLEGMNQVHTPEVAYEEALKYLEATFVSSGPPADVLWKRLRDGRRVNRDDYSGFDNLLRELVELWNKLTAEGRAGDMEEQRVAEDVKDRLPVQITCDYVLRSEQQAGRLERGHRIRLLMQLIVEYKKKARDGGSSGVPWSCWQIRPENGSNRQESKPIEGRRWERISDQCPLCDGDHTLQKCQGFLRLPVRTRKEAVTHLGVCFACLLPGHRVMTCTSKTRCTVAGCGRTHAAELHDFMEGNGRGMAVERRLKERAGADSEWQTRRGEDRTVDNDRRKGEVSGIKRPFREERAQERGRPEGERRNRNGPGRGAEGTRAANACAGGTNRRDGI